MEIKSKFIYGQAEGLGAGIIIANSSPPLIGHILKFNDYTEMLTQINKGKFIAYFIIPGYSILIVYSGILGVGNRFIGGRGDLDNLSNVLKDMGMWYYEYKILLHPSPFKRYLLQGD